MSNGAFSELQQDVKSFATKADKAVKAFEKTWRDGEPDSFFSDKLGSVGKLVSDLSEAMAGRGSGLGEGFGEAIRERLGTEGIGTSVGGEVAEAGGEILGEIAELGAEFSSRVGGTVVKGFGDAAKGVGEAYGSFMDAGRDLRRGEIGGAVDKVIGGVGKLGKAGFDIGETALKGGGRAIGEIFEGAGAVGREIFEGAAEVTVAAAKAGVEYAGDVADFLLPSVEDPIKVAEQDGVRVGVAMAVTSDALPADRQWITNHLELDGLDPTIEAFNRGLFRGFDAAAELPQSARENVQAAALRDASEKGITLIPSADPDIQHKNLVLGLAGGVGGALTKAVIKELQAPQNGPVETEAATKGDAGAPSVFDRLGDAYKSFLAAPAAVGETVSRFLRPEASAETQATQEAPGTTAGEKAQPEGQAEAQPEGQAEAPAEAQPEEPAEAQPEAQPEAQVQEMSHQTGDGQVGGIPSSGVATPQSEVSPFDPGGSEGEAAAAGSPATQDLVQSPDPGMEARQTGHDFDPSTGPSASADPEGDGEQGEPAAATGSSSGAQEPAGSFDPATAPAGDDAAAESPGFDPGAGEDSSAAGGSQGDPSVPEFDPGAETGEGGDQEPQAVTDNDVKVVDPGESGDYGGGDDGSGGGAEADPGGGGGGGAGG